MMRMLWKIGKGWRAVMLTAWTVMLLFCFFAVGETPIHAEQAVTYSHTSSNLPCPKCNEPLTVVSVQEATCTVRGHIEYNCDECNQYHEIVYDEALAPHSWQQVSSTAASCTKSGSITRRCKVCREETEVANGSALGHNHKAEVIQPTCSSIGYTSHTCVRCGDSYRDTETAMTAHTYSQTVESEPTCQTVGFLRHTCLVCDQSYTEEVAVVEHDWSFASVESTHTEQGYTVYTCRFCETVKRENFTELRPYEMVWTVQEATCTASGLKIGYCSDGCGHTETVVLPRLSHAFGEWMTVRLADEDGDGIESHVCSRCEISEMRYIPYDPKVQAEPAGTLNWLALGSLAVVSVVAVILVVVLLLLLLEHARRDRTRRSRRASPSASFPGEV